MEGNKFSNTSDIKRKEF